MPRVRRETGNASRTTMFGEEVDRGGERKVVGGRWNSYRDLILYIAGEDERRARKRGKKRRGARMYVQTHLTEHVDARAACIYTCTYSYGEQNLLCT